MKKAVLIFLILLSLISKAQPIFTAQNCLPLHDSTKIGSNYIFQSFTIPLAIKGPTAVWDFSANTWTAPTVSYVFQPASLSIYAASYPTSQLNEYTYQGFGFDRMYSYSSDLDTLYYEGENGAGSVYRAWVPVPYLSFPLNFNDSVYTSTTQVTTLGGVIGTNTRYWIYDGFGTLILPYGTINNVYRIHTKQIDSTFITGTVTPNEQLIWFNQNGIPVLRIKDNGANTMVAFYCSANASNGLLENNENFSLELYPNPSNGMVSVNGLNPKNNSVFIYDALGNLVQHNKNIRSQFSISNLNSGIYFVELINEKGIVCRKKIIKE